VEEWDRIATELMPAVSEGMGMAALHTAQQRAALALDEARALATRPCANPRCVKIVGCRERDAVVMRCQGCTTSRYCCLECQKAAWRAHNGVCGELRAERATGEAA
jgi:hypothetical protein